MVDVNVDTEVETNVPSQLDTEKPTERRTVRESLERTFEDARRDEQRTQRDQRRDTNRRDETGKFVQPEEKQETETEVEPKEVVTEVTTQPPTAWTKEAKEAWGSLPEHVQAAITKREADTEKGVTELKAKYSEIDKALAPHVEAIKRFNKTPAEAVKQLFDWFQALAQNPDQAFPALIKSYNYDPNKIVAAFGLQTQPPKQETKTEEQPEGDIPPAVQSYITKLEEKLNGLQAQVGQQLDGVMRNVAEQSMAKTHETLNMWAKDKPHFEEVRTMMGHLLTPDPNTGVAAVPLKDGKVDLDTAYDMAVWARPDIRNKIMAEEKSKMEAAHKAKVAAEAKAQKEQAEKAKRASGSLPTGTPGADVAKRQQTRGKSVKESIRQSIEELSS
jgi:hypothetical protein